MGRVASQISVVVMSFVLLALAAAVAAPVPTPGTWQAVAGASRHALELKDGRLSGEGFDFLMKELEGTEFVVLGEEHNTAEIPPFTAALFRALHDRLGYQYFAEEQDPLIMERASTVPARGDRAALEEIARKHPYAYTFVSDEEIAMLAEIGAVATGRHRPLWGCEQAFGATLYLEELVSLAPSPEIRSRAEALLERAREAEKPPRDLAARHFMSMDREKSAALASLRDAWAPREGSRAAELLGALVKVLMKYGHVHAQRGRSPMNAFNIGNFVSDVATLNGKRSFHIAIVHYGSPAELAKFKGAGSFLAKLAPAEQWELLDLRPLQPWLHAGKLDGDIPDDVRASVRDFLFGFDAVLFMPHGRHGTYTVTGAKY